MFGRGLRAFGITSSIRFMASDGSRSGLPPLPIVDDAVSMKRDMEKEHGRVARAGASCCLILVRPDNLPEDETASQIVDAVGKRFSHSLRPYDSLYRFGPDMFLIALSHIKVEDTRSVMNRLNDVVSRTLLRLPDGSNVPSTASLGGTMMDPAKSVEENLDAAGRSLFAASKDGGNKVCLWSNGEEIN